MKVVAISTDGKSKSDPYEVAPRSIIGFKMAGLKVGARYTHMGITYEKVE